MNSFLINNGQQIFNTFDFAVLVEDTNRNIQFVNSKFLDIFNIPGNTNDLKGLNCIAMSKTAKSFFRQPDKFEEDIINIPLRGEAVCETIETSDGRFFKRKYSPIYNDEKLDCFIWSYEEVTELVKKEQELVDQKTFYNTVLNEIPADIAIFSPEHKYIYLNKTAIKSDEVRTWLVGKDDYDYCKFRNLDTKIADKRRALFDAAKATRSSEMWVDERKTPEGKDDYVLRIFYPYINASDNIEFVIGYGINITQQKEQEKIVAEEKERFRVLIDTLNDAVFQITFEGRMMFYNRAFLRTMKISDDVISENYTSNILQHVHPDDKASLYCAFNNLIVQKKPQKGIFRVPDIATGNIQFVEYIIWHRHDSKDGNLVAGRLSDVTERVVNEQNMIQLIEKEKHLNTLQSNFVHITSHELRTPLSVIMSSAEILEMYDSIEDNDATTQIDRQKFTSGIVKEVTRITDILNELLVVGRFQNNKAEFKAEKTNLRLYVDSLVAESYAPYADGRNLDVMFDARINNVLIDRNLMRHAIVNLVNNAFKYSQQSKNPQLNIFKSEGNIHIQVRDFGIGIPKNEIPNLFNSFYRASNVGNISGTGIGLMVVDHVAKAHRGEVIVKNNIDEGATFTIVIPDSLNRGI